MNYPTLTCEICRQIILEDYAELVQFGAIQQIQILCNSCFQLVEHVYTIMYRFIPEPLPAFEEGDERQDPFHLAKEKIICQ